MLLRLLVKMNVYVWSVLVCFDVFRRDQKCI